MNDILNNITQIVETYESGEYLTLERLTELRRSLTSNIYHLTKYKIEFKNKHNEIKYKHKGSVAAGEILAHEQAPELYQIRYIMRAAERVDSSLMMEQSILKNENT